MKITTILLMIVFGVVLAVTFGSYFFLTGVTRDVDSMGTIDKAALIYERSLSQLEAKNEKDATKGFIYITEKFPRSEQAQEALNKLTVLYTDKGQYDKAKSYYDTLSASFPETQNLDSLDKDLKKLNLKNLNALLLTDSVVEYTVKSGDTLSGIAKKFHTTVELIQKTNGLKGDVIFIGQKLRINVSVFSILIDKSTNVLILKKDGKQFKTYSVATGRNNSTPVGVFTIVDKMIEPVWTKPGVGMVTSDSDEYELGARWMPISVKGYGIHGTNDASSIGKQSTAGCIRMRNEDVIELYDLVPRGTEVEIVDSL